MHSGDVRGMDGVDWMNTERYQAIRDALDKLITVPEELGWIDEPTYLNGVRASEILETIGVRWPRIWTHGGDAVVFTWEKDGGKLLLTVSDG